MELYLCLCLFSVVKSECLCGLWMGLWLFVDDLIVFVVVVMYNPLALVVLVAYISCVWNTNSAWRGRSTNISWC